MRLLLAAVLGATTIAAQSDYKKSYASDIKAFVDEVQKSYPFFDLKGIGKEWRATADRLEKEAKRCKTDAELIALVGEGIRCLRDAHMQISECKVELPRPVPEFWPGVSFLPATQGRVVVMHAPPGQGASSLRTGTVVLTIDGKDARQLLDERAEAAWKAGGSFSSPQRARLFEYRLPLRGGRGAKHVLEIEDGKARKKVTLSCRDEVSGWAHTYNQPAGLEQVGKSFQFAELESGIGYMYLRRVDESIAEGMAKALAKLAQAKGWIVDLCGNSGGGYDDALLNQVKAIGKPVVVILDAGCISAGETLARDFVRLARARLIGSTTAGSSSSKRAWTLPSGIATVRFSTRSRSGPDDRPIEFHGVEPDELVEAVPEELLAGKNSAIVRAEKMLLESK